MKMYVLLTYVNGALVDARECESVADVLDTDGGSQIIPTPEQEAIAGAVA